MRNAAPNLAAMMLVGETGLVRLQASVPRSRSIDTRAMVATIAMSATVIPVQPSRTLAVGSLLIRPAASDSLVAWAMNGIKVMKTAPAMETPATMRNFG